MLTARELNNIAKQVLEAKFQTDNNLERAAFDAAVAALLQMQARAA